MGEEGKCMEAHLMHTSNAAYMGCATSPEMEKTQIKNKAQVDPKDPAWQAVLWDCSQTVLMIQKGACKWMIRSSLQLRSTASWLSYKLLSVCWDTDLSQYSQDCSQKFLNLQDNQCFGRFSRPLCVYVIFISTSWAAVLCETSVKILVCVKFQVKWFRLPLYLLFYWCFFPRFGFQEKMKAKKQIQKSSSIQRNKIYLPSYPVSFQIFSYPSHQQSIEYSWQGWKSRFRQAIV